ncbi:DUF922 domain-containing protein [Aestuariivirga litoralis]|uniref:DUF922 domain-containing protein n=1 Tax=Aestuariivirga litoralis TaxID=2650924 RepID=UPI0018C70A02|nr:DUF922 domain-containing protein [Aestuariivirga litoralis]
MLKHLAAAFLLCSFGSASAGVTQKTTYNYFAISGSNAASIYRSITSNSELKGSHRTLATTNVIMEPKALLDKRKGCKVASVGIAMTFEVHLPRLSNEAALPAPLRRDWRAFVQHLKTHEEHHRTIWMGCAAKFNSSVQNLVGGGCGGLDDKMNGRWSDVERRCAPLNQSFDAREQNSMRYLPFIRRAMGGR